VLWIDNCARWIFVERAFVEITYVTMFSGNRTSAKRISSALDYGETNITEEDFVHPEYVVAKGYGLSTGLSNQQNIFTLDARHAGNGDFDVVIKGASRATIEYEEVSEALYKVKYHISLPGDYQIDVKYDNQHIPGSPFPAKILDSSLTEISRMDSGASQETTSLESYSTYQDLSEDESITQSKRLPVEARILTPSGRVINGSVYKNNSGNVSVKFPREEVGSYKVTLIHKETGDQITGSPYEVVVKTQKLNQQKNTKTIIQKSKVGESSCFSIFGTSGINFNNLFIAVVGPSHTKLRVYQNLDSLDILYDARKHGQYIFHVHDCRRKLAGSPFDITIPQVGNNWSMQRKKNPLSVLTVTAWHGFDASYQNISTRLNNPLGESTPHSVIRKGRHLVDIRFLPNMNGTFVLKLSFGDDIYEEFSIKVDNYPEGEDLLKISGEGMHTAYTNENANVFIETKLPSSRSFSIEFDGPERIDIRQNRAQSGDFVIEYKGRTPGQYSLSIKYDGFHVARSPYRVQMYDRNTTKSNLNQNNNHIAIENKIGEAISSNPSMCKAYGAGLKSSKCGELNSFRVDALNAGSGSIMAGFVDNRKSLLTEVICKHIGNCVYDVQYKLDYPGSYNLTVLWAGSHIPGSPFKVRVTDENNNY